MIKLYPWQESYADQLTAALDRRQSAVGNLPPGSGKTYIAAEVLRRRSAVVPCAVVFCPASVVGTWRQVLAGFGLADSAHVLNYEQLTGNSKYSKSGELGNWLCRSKKKGKKTWSWVWREDLIPHLTVIFDEAHRCSGRETRCAELMIGTSKAGIPHLLLTATVPDSPLKFLAWGVSLGLFDRSEFWEWAISHGCRRAAYHEGFEFPMSSPRARREGQAHLQRIHDAIFPMSGVVMTYAELLKFFPAGRVYLEPVSLPNESKFEAEFAEDFLRIADAIEKCEIRMVENLYVLQEIELRKLDVFVEQARDLQEQGLSVVVFVNFRRTAENLAATLKCGLIIGEQSATDRAKVIADFQANKTRCVVSTAAAGSEAISLHDLAGDAPRVSLISPVWSPVALRQILGRVHRAGGQSAVVQKILVVPGAEQKTYERCLRRMQNMNTVSGDHSAFDELLKNLEIDVDSVE